MKYRNRRGYTIMLELCFRLVHAPALQRAQIYGKIDYRFRKRGESNPWHLAEGLITTVELDRMALYYMADVTS